MAKKSSKKRQAYEEYFEEMAQDLGSEEKVVRELPKVEPKLVWFYCVSCVGNSKAWDNVCPRVCYKCGGKNKPRHK